MKKHYPNMRKLRQMSHKVEKAIVALAELGVEIELIRFREPCPMIEVAHCPGTEQIRNFYKGQGCNENGPYIRKVAHIQGCQVEWNEARG